MLEIDNLPAEVAADLLAMWYGMPAVPRLSEVTYKDTKFRYATLDAILDIVRPYLAAQGKFAVWTEVAGEGDAVRVTPALVHVSGYIIKGGTLEIVAPVTVQDRKGQMMTFPASSQAKGAAITYARRYAVASILGLCSDDDMDGDVKPAVHRSRTQQAPSAPAPAPVEAWTKAQQEQLTALKDQLIEVGVCNIGALLRAELGRDVFKVRPPSKEDAAAAIDVMVCALQDARGGAV